MHSHVSRTTTSELSERLDECGRLAPGTITPHYMGGRDWVVTLIHGHVPEDRHGEHAHAIPGDRATRHVGDGVLDYPPGASDPERADLSTIAGLRVGTYRDARQIAADGAVRVLDYSAWIEDDAQTWIMYVDRAGRPAVLWLRRDSDGGVIDPGIRFRDDLPGGPGQIEMTDEQPAAPADPGPHLDEFAHPEPDDAQPPHTRMYGRLVGAPEDGVDFPFRVLYADGRTQFLTYRPVMGSGDTLLRRDATDGTWHVVAPEPRPGAHVGIGSVTVHNPAPERVEESLTRALDRKRDVIAEQAAAYADAVDALYTITHAPLSTTIAHLIRSRWLGMLRPPTGRYAVRWEDGGVTVDRVPVPDKPGEWDRLRWQPLLARDGEYVHRDSLVGLANALLSHLVGGEYVEVET